MLKTTISLMNSKMIHSTSSGFSACMVCEMASIFNVFWIIISAPILIMTSSIRSKKLQHSLWKKSVMIQNVVSYVSIGTMKMSRTKLWATETMLTILVSKSFSRLVITDTPCLAIKISQCIQTATKILKNSKSISALYTSNSFSILSDSILKAMVMKNLNVSQR